MFRFAMASWAAAVLTTTTFAGAPEYFSEKDKDFGVTAVGPVLVHYFAIKNTSKQTVTMGTPRIGCGCVDVKLAKAQIEPGETTYLVAYMNTAKIPFNQIGMTKTVDVKVPFLAPVLEEVQVKVTCVARPDMVWSTNDGVTFGTVTRGKPAAASMKVTLYNNLAWQVKETKSAGRYVKAESKEVERKDGKVTYEVTATLTDDCPVGSWMSDLTLVTNAPGVEKLRIPVNVIVVTPINAYPDAVKLGALPMGDTKSMEVKLNGLEKFKVLEVKGGDDQVTVTPQTTGTSLYHTLKVEVKATGDLTRDIQIVTDSKEMPTLILPVSYTVKK